MITAAELEAMRDTAEQSLPDTAVIQNPVFTDDAGGGGGTISWTNAGTVSARLVHLRGDEREIAERVSEDADVLITLPTSTAITTKSRVLMNGGTFPVAAIRDRSREITQRVEAVKE